MCGMARTDSTIALAALTVASGSLDVTAFARFGGVFASVMTSNLVFVAIAAARAEATLAVHSVAALAGYIAGVAAGSALARSGGREDRLGAVSVNTLLALECVLLVFIAVWWMVLDAHPTTGRQTALLAIAALAIGLQGAAATELMGRRQAGTTYLTGTLTGVVAAVATGRRPDPVALFCLGGLLVGAGAAAVLLENAPDAATLPPAVMLTFVSVLSWRRRLNDASDRTPPSS
jgi:uncharacterized membrane protein YoaK (UPF0700 family)